MPNNRDLASAFSPNPIFDRHDTIDLNLKGLSFLSQETSVRSLRMMNTIRYCLLLARVLLSAIALPRIAIAEDWPQWMGPERNGVYAESGLVQSIPEEGLKVRWRVPVAHGYSGPAVANGKVFLTDYEIESGKSTNSPGSRDKLTGQERILCLDAATGETLWTHSYPRPYEISYPNGPRATPTVERRLRCS